MYLSRLAAQKEHAFMRVLHREGFPVPEPVAWSRHTVVMEFIDAFPLRMIQSVPDPGALYAELMAMIVRLAERGLIHGDFNEFNILIKEEEEKTANRKADSEAEDADIKLKLKLTPILIDFPQTLSTNHINAEYYFDRDVQCVKRYFEKRFKYTVDEPGPFLADAIKPIDAERRLDVEVEATGFSKKLAKELDRYVEQAGGDAEAEDTGADVPDLDDEEQESADEHDMEVNSNHDFVADTTEEAPLNHKEVVASLQELVLNDEHTETTHGVSAATVPDVSDSISVASTRLQLSHDVQVAAQKLKTKKKSTGWAI